MYGIQDKINQILRGAETIRKNQSMQPLQPVNSTTTFFAGKELEEQTNEVARLREALELIAAPMRPDGTYNRDRRACELLAKEALATAPEEPETSAHPDNCIGNVTMDEWYAGFSKIESTEPVDEVSKLKAMVMDAAKRGDQMAAHWKERTEKAEAIIKQLHHYAGIIEGFQTDNK